MKFLNYKTIFTLAILVASLPAAASGYDLQLQSDTVVHVYQEDAIVGPDTDHAPLYEFISLDVWEAGSPEFSFHLYGWGKIDLGEESSTGSEDGHLSSAQVRYIAKNGGGQVRAGRMLLAEGTVFEALDGVHIRKSLGRAGLSLYGGKPNGSEESPVDRGDTLAGARAYILSPGKFEIGLSYLHEDGDFGGEEREEAGTDLWFKPSPSLEITGHALYNNTTSGLASDDLSLLLSLSPDLSITLASEGYIYEHLFQAVTNPAFLSSAINLDDEVRITKGEINWNPVYRLDIHGALRNTDHKEADPGSSIRTEIGLGLDKPLFLDRIGLRLASQTGDLPANEYNEMRAYVMASKRSLRWSLDALTQIYEEEISGEDQTIQLVGSAGWKLNDSLDISGDVRLTRSPVYDEDLAVILRARYVFGTGSGAN